MVFEFHKKTNKNKTTKDFEILTRTPICTGMKLFQILNLFLKALTSDWLIIVEEEFFEREIRYVYLLVSFRLFHF